MRKQWLLLGILLAGLMVGGWYWGSPRWTLHEMRAAAEAGDSEKLASYIDFPSLRTSMKEEMTAKMAAEMGKPNDNGFAALGAMLAMSMTDNMVDGMLTPATLRKVFVADKSKGPAGIQKVDASGSDVVIDRKGFDRFLLHASNDADHGLVFTRDGLGWKLSALRLPD